MCIIVDGVVYQWVAGFLFHRRGDLFIAMEVWDASRLLCRLRAASDMSVAIHGWKTGDKTPTSLSYSECCLLRELRGCSSGDRESRSPGAEIHS